MGILQIFQLKPKMWMTERIILTQPRPWCNEPIYRVTHTRVILQGTVSTDTSKKRQSKKYGPNLKLGKLVLWITEQTSVCSSQSFF